MKKFRLTYEVEARNKQEATKLISGPYKNLKISKVRGKRYTGTWKIKHLAEYVSPGSRYGGQNLSPYVGGSYRSLKECKQTIQMLTHLGKNHGWSKNKDDYVIEKENP